MRSQAKATFENTGHEESELPLGGAPRLSRVVARRHYAGDMEGVSASEQLVCRTGESGFGYVGMDVFDGTLAGRAGTFVFQHGELYGPGNPSFGYIVEGSGTGKLASIAGTVSIKVVDDVHHVTIDYVLGD